MRNKFKIISLLLFCMCLVLGCQPREKSHPEKLKPDALLNKSESALFLANNKSQPGVTTLPSGLRAQAAEVKLENNETVIVPLVNMEVVG